MNSLKNRLKKGDILIGGWITLYHPAIAEIFANAGYDWVVVDLEHSVVTIREAEELIRIIELSGCVPLVRLSTIDAVQIKRVMDAGACGVIAPMVKSLDDIQEAVKSLYYPPKGNRGVGLARAQSYGAGFQSYINRIDNDTVFIPQIEHVDAIKNIDSILSHDCVDGYILGPYDLSTSMGIPGQFENQKFKQSIQKVLDTGKKLGKPGGIHIIEPDVSELDKRIGEGFNFIAYSLDIRILDSIVRKSLSEAKRKL